MQHLDAAGSRPVSKLLILLRAVALVATAFQIFSPEISQAANTRVTYPSAITVEVLGRGMLFSAGFDQVVSENLSAGVSIGTVGTQVVGSGADTDVKATLLPVYANYYFSREQSSLFLTGGATVTLNSSSVRGLKANLSGLEFPSEAVIPTLGVGFETRSDTGFLVRFTGYGMFGKSFTPWAGFTFGIGF